MGRLWENTNSPILNKLYSLKRYKFVSFVYLNKLLFLKNDLNHKLLIF